MSLEFNISQLLKGGVGSTRTYEFSADAALDLDDIKADDVHGNVKFTHTNFSVMAAVEAQAVLQLSCARCLESFDKPVRVVFTEEYRPSIDIATGLPSSRAPHTEMVFEIPSDHTIDLTEALRQHLLLAVDLIPICSEGCRGLCSSCGANLNVTSCDCATAEESSPFAALQALFTSESE